ncbi:glycosyltransferase family 4 protein [Polynucleobacter sp. HIN7]|uniref:glycosyltransferase family 4 protein n=1 Tax=Polynucleobacter sp. HIN7 TaxID=3047866 RepID=UPI0025726A12|nr:glycosyltransferase family 1 protein [Polynucleobacter sp. HIN7]
MDILFDNRWIGPHGIGRFAFEVGNRCGFKPLNLRGRPLGLMDPLRLTYSLLNQKKHFFSPGYNVPLGNPCRFSFTLHDLMPLEVPALMSPMKSAYFDLLIKPAIKNAQVVFTVSEYSKKRIIDWSSIDPQKVVNVGNGVHPRYTPDGSRWQNHRPYLLYVGNQKAHKNVEGLIRAYAQSRIRSDCDLLLSGFFSRKVADEISKLNLEKQVLFLGNIPEESLPTIYRGALAFVMPSFYEGFGLPLVEAMACGTPVLTSSLTAIPEVCGNAALYFDPNDFDSFVNGLNQLTDQNLLNQLRVAGIERASQFTWDDVASRIKSTLNEHNA